MPNRSKVAMQTAIEDLRENLPKEALKSFTSDRGKEFACYPEVEAAGIDFYLPMLIVLGKEEPMRTLTVYCVIFFLRKQTSLE